MARKKEELNKREKAILKFIEKKIKEDGYPPSVREIGKPCEDNYTKVLIFKFDNQNEFKVNSYKNEIVV